MKTDEAKKILDDLYYALFEASIAFDIADKSQKEITTLKVKLKECEREKLLERDEMRKSRILLRHYQILHPDEVSICNNCNGAGGFDEYGPCEDCDQTCVIIKDVIE